MTSAFGKPAFIRLFVVKIIRNKKGTIVVPFLYMLIFILIDKLLYLAVLVLACIAKGDFRITVLHQL